MSITKGFDYNAPLTEEEADFAAEHHGIVITFLCQRKMDIDYWYDVVIFRYLLSVRRWFAMPQLHKYSFCTIAYNAMRSAVGVEITKQKRLKRKAIVISIYDPAPSFKGQSDVPIYADILADLHSDFTVIYDDVALKGGESNDTTGI